MTTKMERIKRAIAGETVDRIPYSVWTHFPGIDLDPDKLAEVTYGFYKELDLDFIKTMSNGMFSIEDWGCVCDYSAISSGGVAKVSKLGVESIDDWERLRELDVEEGALGRELQSIRKLLSIMRGEAPVLATAFSPLTTAQKLSGPKLIEHLRTDPRKVKAGLATITAGTKAFVKRAIEAGCSGVYFASQMSRFSEMSEADYREFGMPYDLEVLGGLAGNSMLDVMHIHGNGIMFNLLKDYPVHGISWHIWETDPTVEQFLSSSPDKCIVGGLRRFKITEGAWSELEKDVAEMLRLTGGRKLLLAPGCVIRAPYDRETLLFIKRTIDAANRTR